jgi:hypothetical protein
MFHIPALSMVVLGRGAPQVRVHLQDVLPHHIASPVHRVLQGQARAIQVHLPPNKAREVVPVFL